MNSLIMHRSLAVLLVSLIWGLLSYPYFDMLFNGPVSDTGKFAKVMGLLSHVGIHLNQEFSMSVWILARSVKAILLNLLYTFGGAYMIYCWYHDRVERALQLLKNVTVGFLVVLVAYGLVEVCYQNGQMWAQNFLQFMWPILHSSPHPGRPFYQIVLAGRIRTLFLEPSYFGIYLSFALPILWWKTLNVKGIKRLGLLILYVLLAFELYLAQSRSATAIFVGELVLLVVGTLYIRKRNLFFITSSIVLGAFIAFGSSIFFLKNYQVPVLFSSGRPVATARMEMEKQGTWPKNSQQVTSNNRKITDLHKNQKEKIKDQSIKEPKPSTKGQNKNLSENYISDSFLSLVDTKSAKRRGGSNYFRYGISLANVEIGLRHNPLLGVGTGLDTGYMYSLLKNDSNIEMKRFVTWVNEDGLLASGSPVMCEYTSQFMQTGMVGLVLFIMPMVFIIIKLLTALNKYKSDSQKAMIVLFILLCDIGVSVSGLGNTLNITYCFWLMLGLSYIVYYVIDCNCIKDK